MARRSLTAAVALVWLLCVTGLAQAEDAASYRLDGRRGQDVVVTMPSLREAIIVPGAPDGLAARRTRRLTAAQLGLRDRSGEEMYQLVVDSGDVVGNGYGDLVVGAISHDAAGAIAVVPGGSRGLRPRATSVVMREDWELLGQSVLSDDVDRDGFDDVIASYWTTGDPGQWPISPTQERALRIVVLWGSSAGVTSDDAATFAVPGERYMHSGVHVLLGAGNVQGDARREIVVADKGPLWAEEGMRSGQMIVCTVDAQRTVDCGSTQQVSGGVNALVVGDVVGGGRDDIVLGEVFTGGDDEPIAGQLHVYEGTSSTLAPAVVVAQDSRGVPGGDEPGDDFGYALAVADLDGDGKDDLAVGVPGENHRAGRVVLLYGDPFGLGHGRDRVISQNTRGVPERDERNDRFGEGVALLDVDGNAVADLVATAPVEDGGVGAVTVVRAGSAGRLRPRAGSDLVRARDAGLPVDEMETAPRFGDHLGR